MALSLRSGLCGSVCYEVGLDKKEMVVGPSDVLALKNEFKGRQVVLRERRLWNPKSHSQSSIHPQSSICIPRSLRWWEKTIKQNMIEIKSAQDLVDSLLNAGDNLVIVDFYSPGCGGCRALHPKICQFAELYPNALFLKVNYEEHKSMCQSLHIHVLPFFRFYRGAEGRVCSFSCTNATINKFKNALAKHGMARCSTLRPAKGLEESELLSLASNRQIHFGYPSRSSSRTQEVGLSYVAEAEDRSAQLVLAGIQ